MTDRFSGCNIPDKGNEYDFVRLKADRAVTCSPGNGIHTSGTESFRAVLKHGVYGVFHNVSVKHMQGVCRRLNHRDDVCFTDSPCNCINIMSEELLQIANGRDKE